MPLQNLGMTDWKGSKNNNLIELDGMTTQVYLDQLAQNASERYKIVTGNNGIGTIAVLLSSIGMETLCPSLPIRRQSA